MGVGVEFQTLIGDAPDARIVQGSGARRISAVTHDSRQVVRGGLFVARPGLHTDGHAFITEALEKGAAALLVQENQESAWENAVEGRDVAVAVAPDTQVALAQVAAAFWRNPARALRVVAVTGTKGKTTVAYLAHAILQAGRLGAGLLSSVGNKVGDEFVANETQFTTPEAPEVQSLLAQVRDAGLPYAVVESTSHGLALHRLDRLEPDIAVFTNLYPDHLDFHPDMEHYRKSKGRLFEMLEEAADKGIAKTAILNADDEASEYMRTRAPNAGVLTFGVDSSDADVRAVDVELSEQGSRFRLITNAGETDVTTALLGRFSVSNCLAAATVALSQGIDPMVIGEALSSFSGVPGRMERIDCGQPFAVVVDFAHMPESLRAMLGTLRPLTPGRLIAVFGCGGDRDPGRRTGMGQAAAELADFSVLCNDNPRTEDPDAIIDQIAAPMASFGKREGEDFVRVPDRRQAIRLAFGRARAGDLVLIAGKGHEPYVIVGEQYLPWDDREVAREELRARTQEGP